MFCSHIIRRTEPLIPSARSSKHNVPAPRLLSLHVVRRKRDLVSHSDKVNIDHSLHRLDQRSIIILLNIQVVCLGSDTGIGENNIDATKGVVRLFEELAECFPGCYICPVKFEIMFADVFRWLLEVCADDCGAFEDEKTCCGETYAG